MKYVGQRVKRNEDPRLLTGQALFVDDVQMPGMLHAAFFRSDYAHARIRRLDVSRARQHPGVVAVYTATDLGSFWKPGPLLVPAPHAVPGLIFNQRTQLPMAREGDKVRHAGEALACVIAESRYIAEDAFADIEVDLEPLEVVADLEAALEPGAPLVHEELGTNLASFVRQEKGNYAAARSRADVVLKRRIIADRGAAAALENRGYVSWWDPKSQQMTIWATTQAPIAYRNTIAALMGLAESQVRVIAPFVGGGFGPKIMLAQPEEQLLAWSTMRLGRPIKWIEDRQENFLTMTQERMQIHDVEIALTREGRILGLQDVFIHDTGAYNPYALTVPLNTQTHTMGPYAIPNFHTEYRVVFTNRIIVTPVRGAGRPQGVFIMERMMDLAAKELGMERTKIRALNMIQPDQFPYPQSIIGQDFAELIYDSGNFPATLAMAKSMIGYDDFVREEQPRLRAQGKLVGIGVACFTEGSAVGPYEGARVTVESSGKVNVATGVGTQGQGHFTSFAQIVADDIGVTPADVHITTGDTEKFHWGTGTFASRAATLVGNAIHAASASVRAKILKLASKLLDTPEEELEIVNGVVRVADIPEKSITLGELALKANPLRGSVEPGTEPGLEATSYFGPKFGATGAGTCAMIVEVDPETLLVEVKRFVIAHDCGNILNPLIVDGQIHGGVSMGLGQSFYEKLEWDAYGQLLNANLGDYILVRATDMPHIEIGHVNTPSPLNPMGLKGVGEAGAIPTPACFVQAVEDALAAYGVEIMETPLSPNRLFVLLHGREKS